MARVQERFPQEHIELDKGAYANFFVKVARYFRGQGFELNIEEVDENFGYDKVSMVAPEPSAGRWYAYGAAAVVIAAAAVVVTLL